MLNVPAAPALLTATWLAPLMAWWLLQVMALPPGAAAAFEVLSATAIRTLLALQIFGIGLVAAHSQPLARPAGLRDAAAVPLVGLLPAWPLLAALGMASGSSTGKIVLSQFLAAFLGMALVLASHYVVARCPEPATARMLRSALGLCAAAAVWVLLERLVP